MHLSVSKERHIFKAPLNVYFSPVYQASTMTFGILTQLKINLILLVLELMPSLSINNLSNFVVAHMCFPWLYKIHFP